MSYYRVTGLAEPETKTGQTKINKVVFAYSRNDAAAVTLSESLPSWTWVSGSPDVRAATHLEALEAEALADWNAQRPTTTPLALAQARGEL